MCDVNIKTALDSKVKKYYEKIRLIDAAYSTYFSMMFGDKRWNNLYGISPNYFTVVRKSLCNYVIIGLNNFFEAHGKSDLNINTFFKEITKTFEKNKINIPREIIDFYEYINQNKELIKKLKTHRDKCISHFDQEYFLDESGLEKDAPLYHDEIKDIIKKTLHFIGRLNYIVSKEITCPEYIDKDDYIRLFALYEKTLKTVKPGE